MPSSYVKSGYMIPGAELGECRTALYITVKMIEVCRSHPCIVHVTQSVPYPVFFINPHVAHLDGKEILQRRLPYISFKNVSRYPEWLGLLISVFYIIEAFLVDFGEIEFQVFVSQEITPHIRFGRTQGSC